MYLIDKCGCGLDKWTIDSACQDCMSQYVCLDQILLNEYHAQSQPPFIALYPCWPPPDHEQRLELEYKALVAERDLLIQHQLENPSKELQDRLDDLDDRLDARATLSRLAR